MSVTPSVRRISSTRWQTVAERERALAATQSTIKEQAALVETTQSTVRELEVALVCMVPAN